MKLPLIEIAHTAYSPKIQIQWTDKPWRPETEPLSKLEAGKILGFLDRGPALLQAGADQLDDWATQLENEPVLRHLPLLIGIVAGMREVAADYRRIL